MKMRELAVVPTGQLLKHLDCSKPHDEIAVGTIIADRPPRGPGRALVSASGSYLG
jgi:hypothetical protein